MKSVLKRIRVFGLFSLFVFGCGGCAGPIEGLYPPKPDEPFSSVFVTNHNDWHTGIVIRQDDIPKGSFLWLEPFSGFEYVEVGWGDRDFYPNPNPGLWVTLKAGLWPTQSVLHVVGFNGSITDFFPKSEIVEVRISQKGFENLIHFIDETVSKNPEGKVQEQGDGLLPDGRFYLAEGKFHLFKTCNVWVAQALRKAGCPITAFYAISAKNTLYQTKKFGGAIQSGGKGLDK